MLANTIPNRLTQALGINYPIIMAPMFLVSNLEMMLAAMENGIMGTFPTLNYREKEKLEEVIKACKAKMATPGNQGSFGVNLIVQKTNIYFERHLTLCADNQVPFFITSLGNPKEVIQAAKSYGGKVFCDVTSMKHAEKVMAQGCDGLIAVGQGAGGHAGNLALQVFIPKLREAFPETLIVGAGGVATGAGLASLLALNADGASVVSRFIASTEASVSPDYKKAILDYGMEDIVMTDRISGTPCTVIATPFVKKMGTRQNFLERWLNRNPQTKKIFKTFTQVRGMKVFENAAFKATYKTVWCAGQTVGLIHEISPCNEIIQNMVSEYKFALQNLPQVKNSNSTAL